jgi:hypothetical protein
MWKRILLSPPANCGNHGFGMIKVFFLIFEPGATWERLAAQRRSVAFILATYLVPTLLLIAGVEGWGLLTMGKWQPGFQKFREFPLREVLVFEAAQFILALATVFVAALLFKKINETFREGHDYIPAFTVVAYGLSPMFLLRLLDAAPMINPWTTWVIGVVLSIWILYQGLPRVMMPDPVHAFGLYLSGSFVVILTTGVTRLLTALYVLGQVDFHHSYLTRKLAHWLGQ